VTNTLDSGAGSLRQAILDANAHFGPDTITFNIPGAGGHTLRPLTPLPTLGDGVLIDGYSQPGAVPATAQFRATLEVGLDGSLAGPSADGLAIDGSNCTVQGLVIMNFTGNGIDFLTGEGNVARGNFIGTDITGISPRGNGCGVFVNQSIATIGGPTPDARNVISGNGGSGVSLRQVSYGSVVEGNYIGTDATGTLPLGNGGDGVLTDAKTTVADNVISANGGTGVALGQFSYESVVEGNYIGTDATGAARLGNAGSGVAVEAPATIGGTSAAARNVISANGGDGITVTYSSGAPLQVEGNYIGTDASGTRPLGNAGNGVAVTQFGDAAIGGVAAGAGNVISANGHNGVTIDSFPGPVLVEGNDIGTDATGTLALGNGGCGVEIDAGSTFVPAQIGGTDPAAGNVIAFNGTMTGSPGVAVDLAPSNPFATGPQPAVILSNRIFANGGIGIDLFHDGVTPNRPAPTASFPNAPVIDTASILGGLINVTGRLVGDPGTSYLVQFFASRTPDPSGYGEGETLLGSFTVTTDATGTGALPEFVGVGHVGSYLTATSTNLAAGTTSEFSRAVAVLGPITGRVFHDLNANGVQSADEPGLANWTLYLDTNNNGQYDAGERTAVTDAQGNYTFVNPPAGTFAVREVPQKGWSVSAPAAGFYSLTIAAGQGMADLNFGRYHPVTITGTVFDDHNANGIRETGDLGLAGRTVFLDLNNSGKPDPGEPSAVTDAGGNYRIIGVRPGTYSLRELLPDGWRISLPVDHFYRLTLTSGQTLTNQNFGNYQPVSISGQVFWDTNANHVKDAGEPGLSGWVVYLDANNNGVLDPGELTATTDASGRYSFLGLPPGTYVVREVIPTRTFQRYWTQSLPTTGSYTISPTEGLSVGGLDFGNVALNLGP
jgi:hypothetical protein